MKVIYKWNKKEIPGELKNIIVEVNNKALRNRMFKKDRLLKNDSTISFRLAERSTKEIKEIEIAKSKNGLKIRS